MAGYGSLIGQSRFAGAALGIEPMEMEQFRSSRSPEPRASRVALESIADRRSYERQREFSRLQRESNQRLSEAAAQQQRQQQAGNFFGSLARTALGALLPF